MFNIKKIFPAGLQVEVQGRNVSTPCQTASDCGDPLRCKCISDLCVCPPKYLRFLAKSLRSNFEKQKDIPLM